MIVVQVIGLTVRSLGALALLSAVLAAAPAGAQALPSPPQSNAASDGTDGPGFIRIPSALKGGTGGYVDVAGYQSCRFVTTTVGNDATKNGEVIPVRSQATWQGYLSSAIPGETQVVCCRPAPPADSFCSGGTLLSVSNVAGPDIDGYGKVGASGTSTAQCQDPYGYYEEAHTYSCKVTGSGIAADGVWQYAANQGDTCTSSPTTTYGACSTAGVGGWGNELVTTTDCLGNSTSQGYTGPACYTPPPCTPVYSYHCDQTTGDYVQNDTTCGTGSAIVGTCSYNITTTTKSCPGFGYADSYPDGACTDSYKQCNAGAWGCGIDNTCNAGCSGDSGSQAFAAYQTCSGVKVIMGYTTPDYQYDCSKGRYTYP